jgi:hypothetical protein
MKVFISYASEQRDLAERLALGLKGEGHKPFFDRAELPAGEAFDQRIREAVQRTDLFLFLSCGDSLRDGAYTLTELGFAQRRWPHPAGRVLPVQVGDAPLGALPPYLRSVSVLQPRGDLVAEVLEAVAVIARRRRNKRLLQAGSGLALGILLVLAWQWLAVGPEGSIANDPETAQGQGDDALHMLRVTRGRTARTEEGQPIYRVTAELQNRDIRSMTVVRLRAESQIPEYRFSSRNQWYTLAPGKSVEAAFEGHWRGYFPGSAFHWRVCWTALDSKLLSQNPELKGSAIPALLEQHGQEGCGRWMQWRVGN